MIYLSTGGGEGGGGITPHAPHPIIQQASGQNFKDDVDGFSVI
jgi:hypothetical protein